MHKYFQKQEKLMRKKGNLFTKVIRPEVAEEWKRLTLEERIRRIDEDDLKTTQGRISKKNKAGKKNSLKKKKWLRKKAREKELEEKRQNSYCREKARKEKFGESKIRKSKTRRES